MINSRLKFITSIISLTLASILLLTFLFYYSVQSSINYMREDLNQKLSSIENSLNTKFENTKTLMYQIASSISLDLKTPGDEHLAELLHFFKPAPGYRLSTPFTGSVLVDMNGNVLANSVTSSPAQTKKLKARFDMCINSASKKAFQLNIIPMLTGDILKEPIIPLVTTVGDANNQVIAVICSVLLVNELNQILTKKYASNNYFGHLELQNKNNHLGDDLNKIINLKAIIK